MRASVRMVGGWPSSGSRCWKSTTAGACCQISSLNRPSSTMGPLAGTATASTTSTREAPAAREPRSLSACRSSCCRRRCGNRQCKSSDQAARIEKLHKHLDRRECFRKGWAFRHWMCWRDMDIFDLMSVLRLNQSEAPDRSYSGHKTAEFAHDAHQLTLANFGTFSVSNNFGVWTVPEGCGAWIPAGLRHSIEALPRARTRTLYPRAADCPP